MNVKKLTAGIIVASMLPVMTVTASELVRECEVKTDFVNNTVIVSGNADADENITIMVLKDGVTPSTIWSQLTSQSTSMKFGQSDVPALEADASQVLFYVNDDIIAGEEGKFVHEFGFSEDGVYDIYLYTSSGIKQYQDFTFTSSDNYKAAVDELNELIKNKNKDGFIALLKKTDILAELGITTDFGADLGKAAGIFYDALGGKILDYDFEKNTDLYKCCAAITALKSGNNVAEYLEYAIEGDTDTLKWYNQYITSETAQKYIIQKISNKNITSIDVLSNKLKEALILYVVANPNGYENIKSIFEDFTEITGISYPTSKLKVYSELAGNDFMNIEDMKSKYDDLEDKYNTTPGGGGSSGGGGGGGGGSSSGGGGGSSMGIGAFTPTIEKTETNNVTVINRNIFEDIDNVSWAADAIVELAVKGVISGKTETSFCPNDMITREEFTKLVAQAFAGDVEGTDIAFADVAYDRWSYPYISKAKAAGLINGYSDTLFGATDLISRQDMAVIIYNAGKYKNVEMADASSALRFADDAQIAEYAQEAVYTLKAMGIVNGVSDIDFAPTRNATRAEAAVIIYAMLLK